MENKLKQFKGISEKWLAYKGLSYDCESEYYSPEELFLENYVVTHDIKKFFIEFALDEFKARMTLFSPSTEEAREFLAYHIEETLLQGMTFFKSNTLFSSLADIIHDKKNLYRHQYYDEEKDEEVYTIFDFKEGLGFNPEPFLSNLTPLEIPKENSAMLGVIKFYFHERVKDYLESFKK